MDIVEQVAEEIAGIPGDPSNLEIARIAIEAYQRAIWSPALDWRDRGMRLELRRARTTQLTGHIMHIVGKHLRDHDKGHGFRDCSEEIFGALYESGAEVVTDADRATAGVPRRDPYGMTAEEVRIMEARRIEAMLKPMQPLILERQ